MNAVFKEIAESPLGTFIAETPWAYPALETLHVIGLGLLYGGLFVLALRIFGRSRAIPLATLAAHTLPWVWLGFVLNAASGTLLFISNAAEFAANPAFQVKIALIAAAGLNALVIKRLADQIGPDGEATTAARLGALGSLVIWTSTLTAGRMIAYSTAA